MADSDSTTSEISVPEFWKSLGRRKDGLAEAIFEFNALPAGEAHPSHFADLGLSESQLDLFRSQRATCRRLSHWLTRDFEGEAEACWDFRQPQRRLAVLPRATLHKLLLYAGAALLHPRIAHEVGHNRIHDLVERHGEELHHFALRRASVLVGATPKFPPPSPRLSLPDAVEAGGRILFEFCFAQASPGFIQRLIFRFPASWRWNWKRSEDPATSSLAWSWLHRLLIREVDPTTQPCFE